MGLNLSKGQMYPWVSHTFNIIKGECPHQCSYCYCKRWGKQSPLHFDERELKTNLGNGRVIFVGSSCDDFALPVPTDWIRKQLAFCCLYPDNQYLFQSKACGRFNQGFKFPPKTILGTTLETNRDYHGISKAPIPWERFMAMTYIEDYPKMVSIEPIMDFDLHLFLELLKQIKPKFVSIGADSGNNHLPEPSGAKVKALIEGLKEFTEVKVKDNLKRLLLWSYRSLEDHNGGGI